MPIIQIMGILGVLIIIVVLVLLFFNYQMTYTSRSKNSLKSEKIIRVFQPYNRAPKLSEMIEYHKANGIVRYKIGGDSDNE